MTNDNQDIFGDNDKSNEQEENFDWDSLPEQTYPPKPDLPTGTPVQMTIYEVQTSPTSDSITLMYRNEEHEGLASENYTIFNSNQKFVLDSWDSRFGIKVQAPVSKIKDAMKARIKTFQNKTVTVVLDPREYSGDIYNVNPIKSQKVNS